MNKKVFSFFNTTPESPKWNDWKWQYRNRITTAEELSGIISLNEKEKQDITDSLGRFRMAITPYYASLMDLDNKLCPIRLLSVPTMEETIVRPWEIRDPLNEDHESPVPNIVHRYPDRVLFLVTRQCSVYCRHCVRKRYVGEEDSLISAADIAIAVDYIKKTPQVRDVLISGGDPLTMGDDQLENIISRVRAIPHVEVIRIGTRVPVVLPMRITPALSAMLKKYHPVWMNLHFNHPGEITAQSLEACGILADSGIPLGNQSVLLRNVNDNVVIMKELLLKLVKARVRPYYIYQCDLFEGSEHFRTKIETGIEIIRELTGNISGFAIPKFVIDAPNGGGKVPINPDYIISLNDEEIRIRNYKGLEYSYPQPRL